MNNSISPWMTKTEVKDLMRMSGRWVQKWSLPWSPKPPPRPWIRRKYVSSSKRLIPRYWRQDVEANGLQ